MADITHVEGSESQSALRWHEVAIHESKTIGPGDQIPLKILSEKYPGTPIIIGRNPDTENIKYDPQRSKFEIHMKLETGNMQQDSRTPRRSLKIEVQPTGALKITNLSDAFSPSFSPEYHGSNKIAPNESMLFGPDYDVRNFSVQISPDHSLKAQQVSSRNNLPLSIDTLKIQ